MNLENFYPAGFIQDEVAQDMKFFKRTELQDGIEVYPKILIVESRQVISSTENYVVQKD